MKIGKFAGVVLIGLMLSGCAPKTIKVDTRESAGAKTLVYRVAGQPKCLVFNQTAFYTGLGFWIAGATITGLMIIPTSAAFATAELIALGYGALWGFGYGEGVAWIATKTGESLEKAVGPFKADPALTDLIQAQMSKLGYLKVVRICETGESSSADNCEAIYETKELQEKYPEGLAMLVVPGQYGLRDGKPYLAVGAELYDINSLKLVWGRYFGLRSKDIPAKAMSVKKWKDQPERFAAELNKQADAIAGQIAETFRSGKPPEQKVLLSPVWRTPGKSEIIHFFPAPPPKQ